MRATITAIVTDNDPDIHPKPKPVPRLEPIRGFVRGTILSGECGSLSPWASLRLLSHLVFGNNRDAPGLEIGIMNLRPTFHHVPPLWADFLFSARAQQVSIPEARLKATGASLLSLCVSDRRETRQTPTR